MRASVPSLAPVLAKGDHTRQQILRAAVAAARECGLSGLSIGGLAARVGMSKSGLFAHFGAKEDLQIAVLRAAQQGFSDTVLRPACTRPRGIERLRAIIQGWLSWSGGGPELPGGCVVLSAFHEFDDQPGPVRSQLLLIGQALQTMLARAVGQCLENGDLPPETDIAQVGFDLFGIVMAAHLQTRLFSDAAARDRAQSAIERLLRHPPLLPSPPA